MEQRQQDAGRATIARWWRVIRTWPAPSPGSDGLEAQAKIIWLCIVESVGIPSAGDDVRAMIHAAAIGSECGLSERAVRRGLAALKAKALLHLPDRWRGQITVRMHDPQKAREAWERDMRLLSAANSGQGELYSAEEPESPSEDGGDPAGEVIALPRPEPPTAPTAVMAPQPPGARSQPPFRIEHRSIQETPRASSICSTESHRQECGTAVMAPQPPGVQGGMPSRTEWNQMTAAERQAVARMIAESSQPRPAAADPPTAGEAIGGLPRIATPEWREAEIGRVAALVERRLADPGFYVGFYRRIGSAVVNGRMDEDLVAEILDRLDRLQQAGRLKTTRGAYFRRAIDWEMRKCGLTLSTKRS